MSSNGPAVRSTPLVHTSMCLTLMDCAPFGLLPLLLSGLSLDLVSALLPPLFLAGGIACVVDQRRALSLVIQGTG